MTRFFRWISSLAKRSSIWLKRVLRIHTHERRVFCVGNIAFVKCVVCGFESEPWEVPDVIAQRWTDAHPNSVAELIELEKKLKE